MNSSGTSTTCQQTDSVLQVHERDQWAHFQSLNPEVKALFPLDNYHRPKTHPSAQPPGPSSNAFESSVNWTDFMSIVVHFLDHSTCKCLCLGFREILLIILLIEAILWRVHLPVVFPIFSSQALLKILLLVAQGILHMFFYNRLIWRNDNY